VGVLFDRWNLERSQVDTSEFRRDVNISRVAITAEGPLERLAGKMRSRAQEVFRLRFVADLAVEWGVV
jgi:hypothetical protein